MLSLTQLGRVIVNLVALLTSKPDLRFIKQVRRGATLPSSTLAGSRTFMQPSKSLSADYRVLDEEGSGLLSTTQTLLKSSSRSVNNVHLRNTYGIANAFSEEEEA